MSVLSKFVVPSMSAFPLTSSVAESSSPVKVTFLNPVMSLFESTITANEAEIVPAVIPSTKFNSAAVELTAVLPKVNWPSGTISHAAPLKIKSSADVSQVTLAEAVSP